MKQATLLGLGRDTLQVAHVRDCTTTPRLLNISWYADFSTCIACPCGQCKAFSTPVDVRLHVILQLALAVLIGHQLHVPILPQLEDELGLLAVGMLRLEHKDRRCAGAAGLRCHVHAVAKQSVASLSEGVDLCMSYSRHTLPLPKLRQWC